MTDVAHQSMLAAIDRYAQVEERSEGVFDIDVSKRIKRDLRGLARAAELHAALWLWRDHGIRTRSTRQVDHPEFGDLPAVADVAAEHGVQLPGFVAFTDEEIEYDDRRRRDEEDEFADLVGVADEEEADEEEVEEPVVDVPTDLV